MRKKYLALLLSFLLCVVCFAGCNQKTPQNDGSNAVVRINNDSAVYYDELENEKFDLDVTVTGTENKKLIYLVDQEKEFISVSESGTVSIGSGITDKYVFRITAVLDANRSKNHSVEFTFAFTRGLITGERQVAQVVVTMNGDPQTSRGISWFTSSDVEESDVYVSTSADMKDPIKFKGTRKTFDKAATAGAKEKTAFYNHQCVITGLSPSTTYYYKVGSEEMDLFSRTGSFKTAAATGAVKFFLTTDVHNGANENAMPSRRFYHAALSDAMSRGDIDFAINTGDFVTMWHGGYSYFESEWARAMNISPLLRQTTFVPVSGNHDQKYDNEKGAYAEHRYSLINHYSLPSSPAEIDDGNANGPNYSFDISNAHFMIINIYDSAQKPEDVSKIKSWIERDLAQTDKRWKIAFSHIEVPDEIKAVLEANGVAIAYSGHKHFYRRTKPMASGVAQESTLGGADGKHFVNPRGTTYVVNTTTGGADEFRPPETAPYSDADVLSKFGGGVNYKGQAAARGWGMYTLVTVDDVSLTAELYVRAGNVASVPFELYETYGFILQD